MTRRHPELIEFEGVLRRVLDLSSRDQLRLYEKLTEYLSLELGLPLQIPAEIALRIEGQAAMRTAADYLKLPAEQAPTGPEFDQAASKLGLTGADERTGQQVPWTAKRLGSIFRRYRWARTLYEGGRIPETPAQRSLRSRTLAKQREAEDYLVGVRQFLRWLGQQPEPDDDSPGTYDRYAEAFNNQLLTQSTGHIPLVKSSAVRVGLSLTWRGVLAVARKEMAYEPARRCYGQATDDSEGPLRLIGATNVARLLGCSREEVLARVRRGEVSEPAVVLNPNQNHVAWLRDDVEALAAGQPPPQRERGWMQNDVVLSSEVAARLQLHIDYIRTMLSARRPSMLQPDGKVSGAHYWVRVRFDAWFSERPVKRVPERSEGDGFSR